MNNLQKIRMWLLLINIRLGSILTYDAFREEDHPRDEGGKFSTKGSTGEHARAKIDVSPKGANKFKKRGFKNKQKLANHWKDHGEQYPGLDRASYEKTALDLIESPTGKDIAGHIDKDGVVIRYRISTNDFAKGNPKKGIFTMFKPDDGRKYYETRKKEDIDNGGKE